IHRRTAEKLAEEEHRKEIKAQIPAVAFTMTLEELELSDRIYSLLSTSGYETIGDLMFQLALDEDAVLGISGIGPKAMDEIREKIENITFPIPEPEVVAPEVEEQPEPEVEPVAEAVEPSTEEIPASEQPETVEVVTETEPSVEEEEVPIAEQAQPEMVVEAEATVPSQEEAEEEEAEKPVDFDEIFALRPEILSVEESEEDEEEEEIEQKGKKKKKKKKKFVEVVYDPDRDITVVKRKRKRGGDWDDDWNY
ncbi:MAG TPA: DNA-directed RNA polymerase subunit alpha C-terminal domain-containing protein, partial [Acidobacteriota bacterium]|nr:DNA-directed RNA polymerase subunit alpha C-terminal domain-containing protein [Acidobacteriota bacterium]